MTAAAADVALKGRVGDPFSSAWRRRLPLLPALLYAVAITQLPFLVSIYYSFTNLKDKTQSLVPEPTKFVGIANYKQIFSDPFFRKAMWTSVQMTVLAVVLSLVFGTLFALLFFLYQRRQQSGAAKGARVSVLFARAIAKLRGDALLPDRNTI